jgi:hypothetical protein
MIVPTILDLSYQNVDLHYPTHGVDYQQLVDTLNTGVCLIQYAGEDFEHSTLYEQLEYLPQAYRTRCKEIIARLPKRHLPDWNGDIDSPETINSTTESHVIAVSRAKFYGLFQYPVDSHTITIREKPQAELTIWSALQVAELYKRTLALWHREITPESRLSELWNERFQPLLRATKWNRIVLVDRYFFAGKPECNFDNLDFLLKHLDSDTVHNEQSPDGKERPFTVHIAVEKEMIRGYNKKTETSFDYTDAIIARAKSLTVTTSKIRELVIYAFNRKTMQVHFHDRYMFLRTPANDPLLYTYELGIGFQVFGDDRIDTASSFHFKMYYDASECIRYKQFDDFRLKVNDPKSGPNENRAKVRILFDS